jgi:hypothetical protein
MFAEEAMGGRTAELARIIHEGQVNNPGLPDR